MIGSNISTLLIPIMSETMIRDTVADQSYLATSSHQHLHLNGSLIDDDIHNHPKFEIFDDRKNRRDRINVLHLLCRQLMKILSHNFYVTQRQNKQEIRYNARDDNEMKEVLECNGSTDANLCDHSENNYGQSKNVDCNRVNDECYRFQPTPAVYQDPYCAVTVNQKVYVYGYYVQSDKFIDSSCLYNVQNTRTVCAHDIVAVFHTDSDGQLTGNICRSWGLSRNSVWWAADPQRSYSGKKMCLVVLQLKEHPILIGFTVIKLVPFINALKICGLNEDCNFISSLPTVMKFSASGIRQHEVSLKETKAPTLEVSLENNMDEKSK